MTRVTLSLISHTNVGKTTLCRTLLRQDVGDVLDQAHVTEASEAHALVATDDAELRLWDTPGFGDTARLMRRLRRERDPLGWFLHQIWDRLLDRPLYCSQRAVHNVRAEADVVLYLINAAERPEEAGYVPLELELLGWMNRPTLLLLNQVGDDAELETARWRAFAENWPVVRDVLTLDAFTRCWVEEDVLLRHVVDLLDGAKADAMRALLKAWNARNLGVFKRCCSRIGWYLAEVATDAEYPLPAGDGDGARGTLERLTDALRFKTVDKQRAIDALNDRLDRATGELMTQLIAAHGLVGESAKTIEQQIRDFEVRGPSAINERSGAVVGAVISGAVGGLAADLLSGGLTLGGGMIAGGLLGALGGGVLAKAYRVLGGPEKPRVRWSGEFLQRLTRQVLLRYLAVAHFGRGRGRYEDLDRPERWNEAVESTLEARRSALDSIWADADSVPVDRLADRLLDIVEDAARKILADAYPRARPLLTH